MSFLPIVNRELRVASRRGSTYWTRLGAALAAIVVASFTWIILMRSSPKETGFFLFMWLALVAYVYCLLVGFLTTADSLSEEKREGTLGLLFLTDLKGYDVVLGKLVASSVSAFYGLLAIFPVLGVALLMGGVALAEFARVMLVSVNVLFLSIALGILASSMCKDERKAMGLAFFILLVLTLLLPAAGGWVQWKLRLANPPAWMMIPSPGYACFAAFDETYTALTRQKFNYFYHAVATIHGLSWAALLLASHIVPRTWKDKPASAAGLRKRTAWRNLAYGAPSVRRAFRRRLLDLNPFYWLAARDRFKVTLVWLWMLAVALVWLVGLVRWPQDWRDEATYITTAFLLHTFFKGWIAIEAPRRLGIDRQSGALELLLATPLSVRSILQGQWLALLRQFGLAVLLVILVDLIFLYSAQQRAAFDRESLMLWLVGLSIFVLDCVALGWVGMWLGLTRRKSSQASTGSLLRICFLPWLVFFMFTAFLATLDVMNLYNVGRLRPVFFMNAWFVISVAVALTFGLWSYRRLHRDFRTVATQRFESRGAAWGRWLGLKVARLRQ